jgi:predicted transposase YbfD/YdcC
MLQTLLASIDSAGAIVAADALHCQRDTAEAIVGAGGHYIFTVRANQPKLRKQLKELPWKHIPMLDTSIEQGHGRTAKRILKATAIASGILFQHGQWRYGARASISSPTTACSVGCGGSWKRNRDRAGATAMMKDTKETPVVNYGSRPTADASYGASFRPYSRSIDTT